MGSKMSALKSRLPSWKKKKKDSDEYKVISRAEWQARVPQWREDLVYPALSSMVTYTNTTTCDTKEECVRIVQDIQNTHMDKDGLPDIEYNFLVGGDGSVFEGRGWHTISNRNTTIKCVDTENPPLKTVLNQEEQKMSPDRRIVVAFIGKEKEQKASKVMEEAAAKLIQYGINSYYLEGVITYQDVLDGKLDDAFEEVMEAEGYEDDDDDDD